MKFKEIKGKDKDKRNKRYNYYILNLQPILITAIIIVFILTLGFFEIKIYKGGYQIQTAQAKKLDKTYYPVEVDDDLIQLVLKNAQIIDSSSVIPNNYSSLKGKVFNQFKKVFLNYNDWKVLRINNNLLFWSDSLEATFNYPFTCDTPKGEFLISRLTKNNGFVSIMVEYNSQKYLLLFIHFVGILFAILSTFITYFILIIPIVYLFISNTLLKNKTHMKTISKDDFKYLSWTDRNGYFFVKYINKIVTYK